MFGLGANELLIILVLALVIFGAGKLPQVGGALGQGIRNFKKGMNEAEDEKTLELQENMQQAQVRNQTER